MNEPSHATRIEPRWPVVVAILALLFLLAALPGRIRLFPVWFPYAVGVVALAPIAAVSLASARARWLRVERTVVMLFSAAMVGATVANLANLVGAMVHRSGEVSGLQLLASSIGVWVTNVIAFSLLYWQIDRGGPGAREKKVRTMPDWLFPQEGAPPEDLPPDWRPTFVDYLFLGFNTATAFSPTDALPLTSRAKMLMMLQCTISLTTIVVVASRAINILGG
jgi:hypothetical protein